MKITLPVIRHKKGFYRQMQESRRLFSLWRLRTDWPFLNKLKAYLLLMRVDRPIGILLLLWPTYWALWVAGSGMPDWRNLWVFTAGVFVMRSAGCVINDFADRKIDGQVMRTRSRPLATGWISPSEALALFIVLCACAFWLVLHLNAETIKLSWVGGGLAILYPFTKRFTYLPQAFLGMAFGWAVPMAFAAELGEVPPIAWLMFIATVLWATIYDTMYAMVDRPDDIRIGVRSTAILFGDLDRHIIGLLQGLLMVNLFLLGKRLELGWVYGGALLIGVGLFVYQQYLIRDRDPSGCFAAFLNNNWFGFIVFVGLATDLMIHAE